ncbi:MAG: T9SS type A sorting domain-containing protein [Cytophagales bacterium]
MKKLLLILLASFSYVQSQSLPSGGTWGCPTIPTVSTWDTTCFKRTSELKLGQGFFTHFGASDPVHFVIPQNRPSFALSIALGWNYFRNVIGTDALNINYWSAIMIQENGFATYNGVQLPTQVFDVEDNAMKTIGCLYPRGCNSNTCVGAGYCWHVSQNLNDGPYHNTLDGYITAAPYFPQRYKAPANTFYAFYNSNMPMATMAMTFYNMSIYRRAQLMNNINLGAVETASPDAYGLEAALAVAYNLGPNSAQSIGAPGYVLPAGIATNNFWAGTYFSGGVSNYAQRVSTFTAVLSNDEAYKTRCNTQCPNVNDYDFYSFYDSQIRWDTVALFIDQLLKMYPEVNAANFKAQVKPVFDQTDVDGNGTISYRYEMGAVIDKITMLLPKEDPGFSVTYAINGTGCKLGCRAPYATIKPQGSTTICNGQAVVLKAEVDGSTPSTIYRWFRNGTLLSGRTSDTLNATLGGTYSIVVCWQSFNTITNSMSNCCATPECEVTVTQLGNCNTCINMSLNQSSNQCTGQPDGSISVTFTATEAGPFTISWQGALPGMSGSMTVPTAGTYTIPDRRDGRYAVTITRNANTTCRNAKDVMVIPVTVIKERVEARKIVGTCDTKLFADIKAQQPSTCRIRVAYGALNSNWDKAYSMDLRVNGSSMLYMFEGFNTNNTTDARWDWFPYNWPNANAPNVRFVDVNDGDILQVTGTVTVPMGVGFIDFFDGGVRLGSTTNPKASFTNLGSSVTDTFATFRYKPPATSDIGTRFMNGSFRVNCPVQSPPTYTFSWSPPTGLNNAGIQNPSSSHNVDAGIIYTVTATHPVNNNCRLQDTVFVPKNCTVTPVDLLSFDGFKTDNKIVVNWNTQNESDLKVYIVEVSVDGKTFLPQQAYSPKNSKGTHTYGHELNFAGWKQLYIRLKVVEESGEFRYSNVLFFQNEQYVFANISPNPFSSSIRVKFNQEGKYNLSIFNLNGSIVDEMEYLGSELIVGEELRNGVYFLKISTEYDSQVFKIVKQY